MDSSSSLESPSSSTSLPSPEHDQSSPPNLTTQYSNIPDSHILEELFHKIQYFNKRALSYYILIDLFYPDTVESGSLLDEPSSDDSGLDSSFTSA